MIRNIPLIGRLVPDNSDKERQVKEIVGTISIGNGISKCMKLLQLFTTWIIGHLPMSSGLKGFLISIFNYNDRQTYLQNLYKMMLDAEISSKYANAYLMLITMKIPLYVILYNWKPLYYKGKTNETLDDKLHAFTAGNPNTDPETGLNETDKILLRKVQQFIQIKRIDTGTLDVERKLSRAIIKEACSTFLITFLVFSYNLIRFILGLTDGSVWDTTYKWIVYIPLFAFYVYFLVTGIILTSLAIDNEESFNPSKDNDNTKRSEDGTINFH